MTSGDEIMVCVLLLSPAEQQDPPSTVVLLGTVQLFSFVNLLGSVIT